MWIMIVERHHSKWDIILREMPIVIVSIVFGGGQFDTIFQSWVWFHVIRKKKQPKMILILQILSNCIILKFTLHIPLKIFRFIISFKREKLINSSFLCNIHFVFYSIHHGFFIKYSLLLLLKLLQTGVFFLGWVFFIM